MDFLPSITSIYCLHCKSLTVLKPKKFRCHQCQTIAEAAPLFFKQCLHLRGLCEEMQRQHGVFVSEYGTRGSQEHGCTSRQATDLALSMTSRVKTLERALEFSIDFKHMAPRLDIVKLWLEFRPTGETTLVYEEPYGPPLYPCGNYHHACSLSQATGANILQPLFPGSAGAGHTPPRALEFLPLFFVVQMLNKLWSALLIQGFYAVLRSARECGLPRRLQMSSQSEEEVLPRQRGNAEAERM